MASLLLMLASALLLAVTLLSRLTIHDWWARACEFPRLQIASLAALVALLSPLASTPWSDIALWSMLTVLVYQCSRILPWTRFWKRQMQWAEPGHEERHLSLLVSNVLTPNRKSETLKQLVRSHQPDLVLMLESDQWWQDELDPVLADDWPHSVKIPQDNLYGMHLYSRLQMTDTETRFLIQDDIPSIHTWLTLRNGSRIRFHALHPRPPAPSESEESLWRDAELLLVGQTIRDRNEPTIVAGDLNDVAWSRTTRLFSRISGMLDPRRGRGLFSTFHAHHRLLRWPLDHVFASEDFTLVNMQRLPDIGSDHFPILVTLCYRPSRADEHEEPEADAEEKEDARDTIREARSRDQDT